MRIRFLLTGLAVGMVGSVSAQNNTERVADTANSMFTLGEVSVYGHRSSPIFSSVTAAQSQSFAKNDVAKALNLLPGVTLSQVGPRNEAMIYVRGFDLRSVPVLIDGIPVYVPYDGYVDLARFVTFDVSDIQLSKGYTSVNYGPNAMGGAINLVTRKPEKPFELNGATGWQTGGFRSNLNIGSNLGKFYVQAGVSKFKRDYVPLSKDFTPTSHEDGDRRDNSYSNDEKVSVKLAYKPNDRSEYAISYAYQHGEKGTPVYTGSDEQNSLYARPRYWQWPEWDKQSVYFLSNTAIGASSFVKTRFYYDQFKNTLNSYDDATYSGMTRPYAFSSLYNDYSFGGVVELGTKLSRIDNIDASIQYKQDVHRENNVGEPVRKMSDGTFTAAIENQLQLAKAWMLLTGVSFNSRSSITAQDYNSSANTITDFPSNTNNAVNVQGSLQYSAGANNTFSLSIARKTRFATTKDRYSYRMGTALPNADLNAENAVNYDLSYKGNYLNNFRALFK